MSHSENDSNGPRNLAARMGRWSASHWKTATFGWLAFVVVAFALGSAVGTKQVDQNDPGPGESGRMQKILDQSFKQPAGESVLIQSSSSRVADPAFTSAVRDVVAGASKVAVVQNIRRGPVSKDGHSALIQFDVRGDRTKAADKIKPVLDSVAAVQQAHPGFVIGEFGLASAQKGVETAYGDDLGKAGKLSLPVTLIILLITFGALVAAGIPLLLGLTAVAATFGLIALPSHLVPVAMEAYAMVLLIGLAVGIDYSMFYLKRERQERAAGRSREAALATAAATSGRSVLISGVTVITAMAGMFLTGDQTFESLAFATILVVAVAVLGSLTVLPAVLSRLGDKVDRLRVPFIGRRRRPDGEGGIWGAIVDRVLRRPALSAALAAGFLLALAAPALQLHLAPQGTESFPQSLAVIKTYHRMQQAFPGKALPANVVVKAPDVTAPAVHAAIGQLERRAIASGRMFRPITVDVNRTGTVADVTIPIAGNGTDAASKAAFHLLRGTIVPETVGAVPNTESGVTGTTAGWQDSADKLKSDLLPVIAFVLLLAFALMLLAFRSVVIAAKAIVLNLLSVGAAYGVLVLVFQHGVGKNLIGASSANGIEVVVPLLLFVILFGLSMDYHVFIISRIRETFDRGANVDDAVSHGIKSTAGVVTSAAIVMVCVFSIFATLSTPFFKQFGIGLAAAILIDATIVRAVLLPASMKLLGDWNWYLPSWLEWLPRLESGELEPSDEPEPEPEPEPAEAPKPKAPRRKRRLGFARITGLILIAIIALGLAYVKLASGGNTVSVPAGAKAGQLTLHPCHYGTDAGNYAADCGTLVVKENRHDPHSSLIALPVTRIRALSPHPGYPVFRLQGGPGITNMDFKAASRFAARHDVVLVGYRGVDSSTKLDCPEVDSARDSARDLLTRQSYTSVAAAFQACAQRLERNGVDLAGYTLPERVDDLDAARSALGYERVDLVSESAGTRTAMIYAWRYPQRVHRSVMLGANPPGHFLWDARTTGDQIRSYAALCAHDASCRARTPDLAASLHTAFAHLPHRFWFLPISAGDAKAAAFFGLMNATPEGDPVISAPKTLDTLVSASKGDGSGAWFLALLARLAFPHAQVWGDVASVAGSDNGYAHRFFASNADRGSVIGGPGTDLVWAGGKLIGNWPSSPDDREYTHVRNSNVPTLLIGGNLDFATPAQNATRDLLPHLQNGRQVVLSDLGHTDDFWTYQPRASTHLIDTFLDTGRVDTSLYTPHRIDFTPAVSHGDIAKIIVTVALAFAALSLLSLVLMARRVRRRGRLGRKTSVLVRSVYVLVLGFGGWFGGVLIALAALPTVPLDDGLLIGLSVAVPVGLGVALAWVDREMTPRTRWIGVAAATSCALVGAWLGFNAMGTLFGVITALVGAAAGANLGVLALDLLWDRPAPERSADTVAAYTVPAPL
jgi:RND superfamily putative drug exporter